MLSASISSKVKRGRNSRSGENGQRDGSIYFTSSYPACLENKIVYRKLRSRKRIQRGAEF